MRVPNVGSFNTGTAVFTAPTAETASGTTIDGRVTGDFDDDGNADLAITAIVGNAFGSISNSAIHILFGNDDFGFTDQMPTTPSVFSTRFRAEWPHISSAMTSLLAAAFDREMQRRSRRHTTPRQRRASILRIDASFSG